MTATLPYAKSVKLKLQSLYMPRLSQSDFKSLTFGLIGLRQAIEDLPRVLSLARPQAISHLYKGPLPLSMTLHTLLLVQAITRALFGLITATLFL